MPKKEGKKGRRRFSAAFEQLSVEAEDRILKLTLDKIRSAPSGQGAKAEKKKSKTHRIFSGKRMAFAILVAALFGSITVSAQYREEIEKVVEVIKSFRMKDSLAEYVGMQADAEIEGITSNDILPGEKTTAEYSGVKVTVEQMVSDGEDAYIYFSVILPESLVPEQEEGTDTSLLFQNCGIRLGNGEPMETWFYIWQDAEGKHYGIVNIPLEEVEASSYDVVMTLEDIAQIVYVKPVPTREVLIEGVWELNWTMDCKKTAERYDFYEVIDAQDGIVTTEEVILTPMSIRVEGTIECDDPTYSQVGAFIDGIILKGDITEKYNGSWSRALDGKYTMGCSLKRVIPTEDIIGILVNGESLYFDKMKTVK